MAKKNNTTPVVVTPEVLKRIANDFHDRLTRGDKVSAAVLMNDMANTITNTHWSGLVGSEKPVYSQGTNPDELKAALGVGQEAPVLKKVEVAIWDHRHGTEVSVFTDEAGVEAYRQQTAEENWDDEMDGQEMPKDPKEAADAYFDEMRDRGEEYFSHQSSEINGPVDPGEPEGPKESVRDPYVPAIETLWSALYQVREEFIPAGTPEYDEQWDAIKTVVTNIDGNRASLPHIAVTDEDLQIVLDALSNLRESNLPAGDFDYDVEWGQIIDAFNVVKDFNSKSTDAANWEKNREKLRETAKAALGDVLDDSHLVDELRDHPFYEAMTVYQSDEMLSAAANEWVRQYAGDDVIYLEERGTGSVFQGIVDTTVEHHAELLKKVFLSYAEREGYTNGLKP